MTLIHLLLLDWNGLGINPRPCGTDDGHKSTATVIWENVTCAACVRAYVERGSLIGHLGGDGETWERQWAQ